MTCQSVTDFGCKAEPTTELRWTNWSSLTRTSLVCTACAQEFYRQYPSRVQYAVKINPANQAEREHKAAWKGVN